MTGAYTGGCACGALRYEIAAEPLVMLDCQCRQCQRESGTGHASHLTFPRAAAAISGPATHWRATGDGGVVKERAFCPVCGAPVYMTFPALPEFLVVRAASLDEPSRYRPEMVVWHDAAQPWNHVDPSLPAFARMPPPAEG